MHEQFDVKGGPLDGERVALDKGHDEEVILMDGKERHVYRTYVRHPNEGAVATVMRHLVCLGPNPFS